MLKLDIGFGECPMPGYISIDNGSDFTGLYGDESAKKMFDWAREESKEYEDVQLIVMNGDNMAFKDNTFDKIHSNQCVGYYVTNYKEIVRVLKPNGIIVLGVWADKVSNVLASLISLGVTITNVDWLNGGYDDIDDNEYTLRITGINGG